MSPAITSRNSGYMLIFVLAISSSFAPLSVDFFAPFMPNATRDLTTSATAIQTTLYIFLIGYSVSPFLWGGLADKFGRRGTMLAGIIVYSLASMGCFLASGIFGLSVLRFLQGVGAASGVVIARVVLRDIYGPAGATKAISGMFLIMVWIPILAPVIGGYLASHSSWRISFLIMALTAGLAMVGSYLWQKETVPKKLPLDEQRKENWHATLINPVFARNALANIVLRGNLNSIYFELQLPLGVALPAFLYPKWLFAGNFQYWRFHRRILGATVCTQNGYRQHNTYGSLGGTDRMGSTLGVLLEYRSGPDNHAIAYCTCLPGYRHGD